MSEPDADPMPTPVVVIPTYQNGPTVVGIAERVVADGWRCVVVDDGSTDETNEALQALRDAHGRDAIELVRHAANRGKAAALFSGFERARAIGASHAITLDADGQHDPGQIGELWRCARERPEALVLGERPTHAEGGTPWRSLFGRRVSNALIYLQGGVKVSDSQTGYRVYPLRAFEGLRCRFSRFAFETEILIRAGRAGVPVVGVPIRSCYFPPGERVSHFKPLRDSGHSLVMQASLLAGQPAVLRLVRRWFRRQTLYLPLFAFLVVAALRVGMGPEAQWHPAFFIGAAVGLAVLVVWRPLRLGYEPVAAGSILFLIVGGVGVLSEGTRLYGAVHDTYSGLKEVTLHLWVAAVCVPLVFLKPAWLLGAGTLLYDGARYHAAMMGLCSMAAVVLALALQPHHPALSGAVPFILVLVVQRIARRRTLDMQSQSQVSETDSRPDTPADPSAARSNPLVADASLAKYFDNEADRRERTREMFDEGAAGYDKAEWLTGFGVGPWYRRQVLKRLGLRPGMAVLDVATGTGLVAVEVRKLIQPGGELVGLDPSPGMLAEARRKLDIETIEGYAESIPLADGRFDVVTMGYALRHVGRLDQTFAEYLRVLRPGGRVCLMEIARPRGALFRTVAKAYIRAVVPLLARVMGEKKGVGRLWRYYWDTIQTCVEPEAIMAAMRDAGFEQVRCDTTFGVFKEYLGTKPADAAQA